MLRGAGEPDVGCSGTHHRWSVSQPGTAIFSVHRASGCQGRECGAVVVSGGAVVLVDEPAEGASGEPRQAASRQGRGQGRSQ
jgi:hypothetical protein